MNCIINCTFFIDTRSNFSTKDSIFPVTFSPLITSLYVAVTAPQLSCPITTTNGVFKCSTAYSIEPNASSSTTFPASLTSKISPNPALKMVVGVTLESEHDTITA